MHLALNTARRVTSGVMAQTLCPLDLSSSIHSDSDRKLTCSFESASKLTSSFEQDPTLTPSPELPAAAKTSLYMHKTRHTVSAVWCVLLCRVGA